MSNAFETVPVSGYSVTIPHKEAAAKIAHEPDEPVRLARAANTLVREETANSAARTPTTRRPSSRSRPTSSNGRRTARRRNCSQLTALILGAGGVARAIAHALHREGCGLTITARTQERANRLSAESAAAACRLAGPPQRPLRHAHQLHAGRHAPERGRDPDPRQLPEAGHDRVRHDLHAGDDAADPRGEERAAASRSPAWKCSSARRPGRFGSSPGSTPNLEQMRSIMRKALSPISKALEEAVDRRRRSVVVTRVVARRLAVHREDDGWPIAGRTIGLGRHRRG